MTAGPALDPQPSNPNPYLDLLARTQAQRRLFSVHWEITYRCNSHCSHCYLNIQPPGAQSPDELETDECLRVLDELADLAALNLTLSGGEILVRRDLFEIASHARSRQFLLRLFTNGTLVTPRIADRIALLHPFAVEISLYGAAAETHQRITRMPGSFQRTVGAIRLLRERDVRVVMKTPLMRENAAEFRALAAMAAELGARFRYDITITPRDDGGTRPLGHRLSHADLLDIFRQTLRPELWLSRSPSAASRTCAIARNAIVIDPFGNVYPCVQVRIPAGNVRRQSVRAIWEEAAVWQELADLTLAALPTCRGCELSALCVRCHGLARLEDGALRGPARVNCHEALARRQVLIEKGALPPDFPVPAHLQESNTTTDASPPIAPPTRQPRTRLPSAVE